MKLIKKSPPPITLDLSKNGTLIARDRYGHSIPIQMSEALAARLAAKARNLTSPQEPKPGTVMADGTVYAGISPDTGTAFYAALQDAPEPLDWFSASRAAARSTAHGQHHWRVPTSGELNVLFNNRAVIGGFNLSGSFPAGWYWSSSELTITNARSQRFSDGSQYVNFKHYGLSVRCVRG